MTDAKKEALAQRGYLPCPDCPPSPAILEAAAHDAPLDLEHVPADYEEAIEMLRRAKRDIEAMGIDISVLEDLLKVGQRP